MRTGAEPVGLSPRHREPCAQAAGTRRRATRTAGWGGGRCRRGAAGACRVTAVGSPTGKPSGLERRHGQRQRGQLEQHVVVAGCPVEPEAATVGAAVDEHPPALGADRHGDRFHPAGALDVAIAWCIAVEVPRPQAARAVVAVGGSGCVVRYGCAAMGARERAGEDQLVGPFGANCGFAATCLAPFDPSRQRTAARYRPAGRRRQRNSVQAGAVHHGARHDLATAPPQAMFLHVVKGSPIAH